MAVTVTIGGVDRTGYLTDNGALSINSQLNARDTAALELIELTDRAAGKSLLNENFTTTDDWTRIQGTGELSIVTNTDGTDGKVLSVGDNSGNDEAWVEYNTNIEVDPKKLYRAKIRIRQSAGSGTFYAGFVAYAGDGTTRVNYQGDNTLANQHHHIKFNINPGSTFVEYVGYSMGFGNPDGEAYPAPQGDPDDPGLFHKNVRYIRPVFLVNYSAAAGTYEVDYFTLEEVPLAEVGNEITINYDGTTVFGGYVREVASERYFDSSAIFHRVQADDYSSLCDHRIVAAVYENQTLKQIVDDIVSDHLTGDGFTTTNVATGPTITKIPFNYVSVTDAFNELSEITGYSWYADDSKDIHFIARETNVAPFSITNATRNCIDLAVLRTQENYRNRQIVRAGYDETATQTEQFKGDGERTTFTVGYPVAEAPTVEVDAASKTVGIQGIDTGKDWYWNKNSNQITQDGGGVVLTTSNTLEVQYKGLFPIILKADDDAEIQDRATVEGNTGLYEAVYDDQNIDKLDIAVDVAAGKLRRFALIPEKVSFTTRTTGLKEGQLLTITLDEHNLDGDYLIESVNFQDSPDGNGFYSVVALSGETFGGWVEFFKSLIRSGKKFIVRDNEVVTLMQSFTEQVTFTDTLTEPSSNSIECEIGTAQIGYSEVC